MTPEEPSHARPKGLRHIAGFVISGGIAFAVDVVVLEIAIRLLGLGPFTGRILAIAVATVAGWLAHRRLTFNVPSRPSLGELGRYVGSATVAAILNFTLYAAALLAIPGMHRLAALVLATGTTMFFSYISMKFAVFRRTD